MQIAELHCMILKHLLEHEAAPDLVEIGRNFDEPDFGHNGNSTLPLCVAKCSAGDQNKNKVVLDNCRE
jgi:hypothetical protein